MDVCYVHKIGVDMINNCDYEKLKAIVVSVLSVHPDEIELDSRFCEDLGADSLDMYQMAMEVERTFLS